MARKTGKNAKKRLKKAIDTKQRLLDAGEELFGQKGLEGTSIRDLITVAKCNLSGVNYYFGDKERLYVELFRDRLVQMLDARRAAIEEAMSQTAPTLEGLLRAFSRAFFEPFTDPEASRRLTRLFAREMFEQHLPKGMFLEEMAEPTLSALAEAIEILCPNIDQIQLQPN